MRPDSNVGEEVGCGVRILSLGMQIVSLQHTVAMLTALMKIAGVLGHIPSS
jgi:hypothetical protein